MTRRYDTYDQHSRDDDAARRQQYRAQQSARGEGNRYQQREDGRGYSERLDYAAQNRDHGHMAQRSRQYGSRQHASDYSRDRYAQQPQTQPRPQQQSQQRYAQQPQRQQYSNGHRHAELQQSAKIPRYNPEQDPRVSRSFEAQTHHVPTAQRSNTMAGRYERGSGMYQARPSGMESTVEKAGMFTSPMSFLVRIAIVAVLLIVFGVRFAANSSTMQQLSSTQEQVATQQAVLDDLNTQNEKLQSDIDSRQATLDAYKAKQQASS